MLEGHDLTACPLPSIVPLKFRAGEGHLLCTELFSLVEQRTILPEPLLCRAPWTYCEGTSELILTPAHAANTPKVASQMLTPARLIPYLLRRRLLSSRSILASEGVRVESSDRRNHNLHVTGPSDESYFVKQGRDGRDEAGSLANEARAYAAFKTLGQNVAGRYLPHCHGYDAEKRILVLQSVANAEDLWSYHTRLGRFPKNVATAIGKAFGEVHEATSTWAAAGNSPVPFPSPRPFVLQLRAPASSILGGISPAGLKLLKLIQRHELFDRTFTELEAEWSVETLIHGDVRLRNVLVHRNDTRGRVRGIKLIDWEFASLGDPRWDVGSFFGSYLSLWATSVPVTRNDRADALIELAKYPLQRIKVATEAFWSGYRSARHWEDSFDAEWLIQAVRFAAANLIHTAYELALRVNELTTEIAVLLQLSLNLLEQPGAAASDLLGIDSGKGN